MARIFSHPEVENYFVELDVSRADAADEVCRLYESGKVIVLKNFRFDYDAKLLAAVEIPDTRDFKKLKSARVLERGRVKGWLESILGRGAGPADPLATGLLEQAFSGDKRQMARFVEQMRGLHEQVRRLIVRFFPSYRVLNDQITWRFQETVNENLHVDVYNQDLPDHHVRLFVNLDASPRIWHTSHTLTYLLQNHLSLLDPAFLASATPGRICHALNFAVFKGFAEAGREGCPKHIVFFDPGEVWLVDSRKVSHQIFYGRKALSTEYSVERDSMLDPSTHYYSIVEEHRARRLQGATV